MLPFSFLRLRARPAEKGPPPRNFVDIAFDSESGKIKAVNSDDDPVTFDGSGGSWGSITGTLSSQADLQAALNAKAASTHTHVSADITDASTGGFADAADVGKLLKFGMNGSISALLQIYLWDNGGPNRYFLIQHATALSQNREGKLPDKDGMFGVLPIFANSIAADAVVSVGDVWWDSTLNKARVRLV